MNEIKLEYNSTYISLNLIDELDYVIGGYGKPNAIFLYSLNTFLESFILNSHFYISDQEATHFQIVSKAMFPTGRPILEMLSKTSSLIAVGGIGNQYAKVVSIEKFDPDNPTTYQERIEHYINKGLDTKYVREKYLILPSINNETTEINYLNFGRVEGGFIATESPNSPKKIFRKLCDVTKATNIQAALPIYDNKFQIDDVQLKGIGKDIISKLTDSFSDRQKKIEQYFGLSNQSIPPLVGILLSQSKSITDIPSKIIQLREDFTNLRKAVIKYEKRINEADNIKEQLEAIDEINEFWDFFNKNYSETTRLLYNFWEIADESGYDKSIDSAIDTSDAASMIEDLNLGKVVGKGAKKAIAWYKKKRIMNRFRGVTDMWKLFEKGPSLKMQLPLFEKVFNVKIDEREIIELNRKLKEMKQRTK